VDRQGNLALDPTKNVIDILDAAVKRQDDLRELEAGHVREVIELRARYDDKLRVSESGRIDAIRAVDVGAVNRAAEVSSQQAATLAAQVATSAETLRGQVEAARVQTAVALAAALDPIQVDIRTLRESRSQIAGKDSAAFDPLLQEMRQMREEAAVARVKGQQSMLVEGRQYATSAQNRYLGLYFAGAFVLMIVGSVVGYLVH
jgi:hypothetical protein